MADIAYGFIGNGYVGRIKPGYIGAAIIAAAAAGFIMLIA
eukprot:CAMPEP_0202716166 /NCGR_PEP_ID=MMETSP1385-20130828/98352_1 /ASSEMBLY_ACC=CAM_ASM_000861 /TAXON_ID=933848 /ORGANISM="Elphidium margaritaceum" /LENGTH=39 /DNA_ID= /DNA_START= /DNA_END= /DNA_ORIENTATION=